MFICMGIGNIGTILQQLSAPAIYTCMFFINCPLLKQKCTLPVIANLNYLYTFAPEFLIVSPFKRIGIMTERIYISSLALAA